MTKENYRLTARTSDMAILIIAVDVSLSLWQHQSHNLARFCAGGEHEFLVDHNVDGRVLMPATSYVVTAWEAAAAAAEKPMAEFPAAFADVAIHQAVVATHGQKVTLAVQLAPAGKFYVRAPSDALPCHGSAARHMRGAQDAHFCRLGRLVLVRMRRSPIW